MKSLYIHSVNEFVTEPLADKELLTLLKRQGVDARRLSRFTRLALLGALPLKEKLNAETNIYLGSSFGSPSKFKKLFYALAERQLPSPLDFTANLNNAATFQLAQTLQTQGASLFLAVNRHNCHQPLQLAWLDLAENPQQTALVGWAFEHYGEGQLEGSLWWLVSRQKAGSHTEIVMDFTKPAENRPHFLQYFIELQRKMSFEKKIVL